MLLQPSMSHDPSEILMKQFFFLLLILLLNNFVENITFGNTLSSQFFKSQFTLLTGLLPVIYF